MRQSKASLKGNKITIKPAPIPISLGKPSLRIRLEAYYSLIDPNKFQDKEKWRAQYDEIYKKYGGTYEGERKLASKLAKKYGYRVKLLLAEPPVSTKSDPGQQNAKTGKVEQFDESWYEVSENESGDINFCSKNFDPFALLKASEEKVAKSNPWFRDTKINLLDNTLQFARFLPIGDPLRQTLATTKRSPPTGVSQQRKRKKRQSHIFDTISDSFQTGPFSVLHKLRGQRVCVVIRYVNAIRGTVTGILIAFDKHMDIILRDVEEVYSPRPLESQNRLSNIEVELERRRKLKEDANKQSDNESPGAWIVKRRRMKQVMLRGDNVVSVYGIDVNGTSILT
jgi:small nuclear ribonucleoprotein (snRNP)-like protein